MNRKLLVYLASPYSIGNKKENADTAARMAHCLSQYGMVVLQPLLSHYAHEIEPRSYADWLSDDFWYLSRCDAVYRMPGPSVGADAEVRLAGNLGIPVFDRLSALIAFAGQAKTSNKTDFLNYFAADVLRQIEHDANGTPAESACMKSPYFAGLGSDID